MMERGIRLNNPMSIERNATSWKGMSAMQDDPVMVRFDTPEDGLRAGMKTLITYQRKYELEHIQAIITRFAPPSENNTVAYIADVSNRCHVKPTDYFDVEVPDNLIRISQAITRHEQGACPDPTFPYWYDDEVFQQAAKEALS